MHVLCTPSTMRQFTSVIRSHSVFSCNLPPALLAGWPGSFTCYCGNAGVERIPKWESAQEVDSGEENSPVVPAGNRVHDLSIRSQALYHLSYSQPPIQIESVGRFVFIPILEVALVHLHPRKTLCVQPFSCTYMNTCVSLHSTDQQTCHVFRSVLLPSSATNPCLLSQCLSGL